MAKEKKYHLYILYNVQSKEPVYVGLSCSLKRRIKKHLTTKKFDGVIILESFDSKKEGLCAERAIIKFISLFPKETIVNGLYDRFYQSFSYGIVVNKLNYILNGRMD